MEKFTIIWNTSGDVCIDYVETEIDFAGVGLVGATLSDYCTVLNVADDERDDLVILAVFAGHVVPVYSILATE